MLSVPGGKTKRCGDRSGRAKKEGEDRHIATLGSSQGGDDQAHRHQYSMYGSSEVDGNII
jgi:hypothetical protein